MHLSRNILTLVAGSCTALAGMALFAAPALAQGVAEVSVANGNVAIVRGDSGTQTAATINAPLVSGDYLATGTGSNAEVQFDGISMLRLAADTQVRFVNLAPGARETQLAAGTAELAELQGADGSPQIDTPELSVRPDQSGDYRVTVYGSGETLVTVRRGAATVSGPNGSQTLTPGSTLVANGPSFSLQSPVAFDGFDQFNANRDSNAVAAYNSSPYLSPQLAGYTNFANYGQWQNVPGYGYAWAPSNQSATNFVPYQNGQWTWEPGYGYTWVDNSPYGYATSHYGTWFNNPSYGGWLWQPPSYQSQSTPTSLASAWVPAVVSFFLANNNGGSGISNILGNLTGFLGNSGGAIGWIPLAPGEQYQPWYGSGYTYPNTTLSPVSNPTNVYNYYTNAQYGGATMVPLSTFRSGTITRTVIERPRTRQIVLVRGAVPVVPTASNLRYSGAVAHPIVLARTFRVSRLAAKAAAIPHVTFQAQQMRIRSVAATRPKVVTLAARPSRPAHPVYHPVKRARITVTAVKPVAPNRAVIRHAAPHPATVHRATPHPATVHRATPHPATVHRATPHPATVHRATPHPAPVHHAMPHPAVVHRARPHPAPVYHAMPHPAVVHRATPHPAVVHRATPHPAAARPAPARSTARPAVKATAKPQPKPTP